MTYRKWRAYFVACTLRGLKIHLPALRIAYRHNYSPAEMATVVNLVAELVSRMEDGNE